jgi:cation:H+ antiporter
MDVVYLILGLILLMVSGEYLVRGGVAISRHLRISTLIVGYTVVAFGTSAPEMIVSVEAALSGHPDISVGNVIGSNISNIALVLALSAIILPIPVRSNSVKIGWPVMVVSAVFLYFFGRSSFELKFHEGLLLFLGLIAFILFSIHQGRKERNELSNVFVKPKMKLGWAVVLVVLSSIGLAIGANLLVEGAASIARNLGISERVISISLVAFGTSLPELVASAMAAFRKEADISIGNIIGSNIFNTFGVLGVTGIVKAIPVSQSILQIDIWWMLGIYLLLLLMILPIRKGLLSRWKGTIFIIIYALYIYFLFTGS